MKTFRTAATTALAVLAALAGAPALADPSPAVTAAAAPAAVSAAAPDQVVRDATERVRALITKNHKKYKVDSKAFYDMVDAEIVPHFDLPFIAQQILARNWRGASPEQRERFQAAFKNMLIHSYADALLQYYDSVKAEWEPLRRSDGTDSVQVKCKLDRKNAQPLELGFAMHQKDGDWKIYDIVVENISLVTSFRGQITSEIRNSNLDAVIQRLENGGSVTPAGAPGSAPAKQ